AALPCLLERGEPTEEHLSGVEYGGGLRRADHSAADRTRGQLNLDFPTCGALGTGGELGTSQAPGGGVQSRDDVTRGLRIRRLPAPAAEIGVPCEAEPARDPAVGSRILGANQPVDRCPEVRLVRRVLGIGPEPLAPSL